MTQTPPSKPPRPKVKVMGIIRRVHNGRAQVLGGVGMDTEKNETFYRLMGGHLEMGETTREALAREIREELGFDMDISALREWIENIYTYNGVAGHEVIAVYDVAFKNEADIRDEYTVHDTDHTGAPVTYTAAWADIEDVKAGKVMVYPDVRVYLQPYASMSDFRPSTWYSASRAAAE